MQTLNGKAQNVFLPTNMPVQRVFFSVSIPYITHHESFILKAEEDWGE